MIETLYPVFRHWSDGGSVWIISDTHFNDPECALMDPLWPSPEEYVKGINRYVGRYDTLIHLGDVGDPAYVKYLRGKRKVLLLGNHDSGASVYEQYFDEVYTGPLMIAEKILLSHEPVEVPWAYNIHGHDHAGWFKGDKHLNLAANVIGYKPVNLKDIIGSGALKNIDSIHRITIDNAAEKAAARKEKTMAKNSKDPFDSSLFSAVYAGPPVPQRNIVFNNGDSEKEEKAPMGRIYAAPEELLRRREEEAEKRRKLAEERNRAAEIRTVYAPPEIMRKMWEEEKRKAREYPLNHVENPEDPEAAEEPPIEDVYGGPGFFK